MNHEIFATYRQAEGVLTCLSYDQLDAVQPVQATILTSKIYSLDFYVSSPGNDDVWPAIITIQAVTLSDARRIIHEVRSRIRYDACGKSRIEK